MDGRKRRGCAECSFNVEQPGFLKSRMVCTAPQDARPDPSHGGHECPHFMPKVRGIDPARGISAATAWAERRGAGTSGGAERPASQASASQEEPRSSAELELAAAEARARAARARAEAAEAEAELAEARLRASRGK